MSGYEIQTIRSIDGFDKCEWDHFVEESPQGCIFCKSWWLEAVCPKGFEILVLREGGRIVAGMPMFRHRRPGYQIISMPMLTKTLGVLLAPPTGEKYETRLSCEMKILRELVQAIPAVNWFNMTFHHSFTNWLPFYWAGYKQTTNYTYTIEDTLDLDTVFNNMNKNTRTVIRKAEKCGIVVKEDCDIDTLLELNRKTFAHQRRKVPYKDGFVRDLDAACASHNTKTIFIANDENNRSQSAVYVVHDNKCMYALMSGTNQESRSSGANSLLYWKAIELAHKLNVRFDFTGSMMENVECVLRGFGTRQTPHFNITKATLRAKVWQTLRREVGRSIRAIRSGR